MRLIGDLGVDGGIYFAMEFSGDGIYALSLESRMVLPNMMAEFGAKSAYIAPDQQVFDYLAPRYRTRLARQGRAQLTPDEAMAACDGG